MLRRFIVLALAASVPFALSADAFAANKATYSLKITPNQKSVSKSNPRPVAVTFAMKWTNVDTTKIVDPLEFTDVVLPAGFTFNTSKLGKCSVTKVETSKNPAKTCPKNSNIGTGKAGFVAAAGTTKIPANTVSFTKNNAPKNGGILEYNSGNNKFFIFSNAVKPVQDQRVFPGQFIQQGTKPVLRIPIYKIVVANLTVSVTSFDSTIKNVFRAGTSCPSGGWKSQLKTKFRKADGSKGGSSAPVANATVRCR